ncbi:MAG: hypothetical protein HY609_04245 [Deltaproteobacteria bacterium]|nr:hypothetical protein [Deltaproteobacteria bacterium]MBI4224120.1 hypothetical protein [Deltaproteobacteria bacterium]
MLQEQRHLQVVAALALLEEPKEAKLLQDYLSEARAQDYQAALGLLEGGDAAAALKALRAQEDFSGIAEIHPAWLLEVLKSESPRIIGVVLRHLPSRHVRYLLEHLPRRLTMELPKLIEAFYVPGELLNVIRRRIERRFVPMRITHDVEQFGIQHLYYLKAEELEALCYDLGLGELALSLVGSSRKILQIILNRFKIGEAKEILARIKRYQGEPRWFLKDARYSVLELGQKEMGARRFLEELGLVVLAKTFVRFDRPVRALYQKMAPERAYTFKRYLDESLTRGRPEKTAKRTEWVLQYLERLSGEEKVDPLWKTSFQKEAA